MRKKIIYLAAGFITFLIIIQFIHPDYSITPGKTSGDISHYLDIPPAVIQTLETSCYDCHSENTKWPWYSRIAPMSWLIGIDVHEGREHLNMSTWDKYSPMQQAGMVRLMCRTVEQKRMPPRKYTFPHPDARLTADEKEAFCSWANSTADKLHTRF